MSSGWKNRFKEQITELDGALAEPKKITHQDFNVYKEHVLALYDAVITKVADIPQIEVTRPIITRSEAARVDVRGVIETVHALVLRFHERRLELHPEGLNFGRSRGRVRFKHTSNKLSRFLYASLEVPAKGTEGGSPAGGLVWVLLDREQPTTGEGASASRSRLLDDGVVEEILEKVFLA